MKDTSWKKLHDLSFKTRDLLEIENVGSCFDCLKTVAYDEITRWTDDGQTAICPHCSIDSVLPGIWKRDILEKMYDLYFTYHEEVECEKHVLVMSLEGIYCSECDEVFEDNTGSNLMGG